MLRLAGKVALVTGVGGPAEGLGNGQAIATLFCRHGARVFGIDRDRAALAHTAAMIANEDGDLTTAICDVTDDDSVSAAVADCVAALGRIDILVNNVGRSEPGGLADLAPAIWREQLSTNLESAYLCSRHVLPVMEEAGQGSIVSVSSAAGLCHIGKDQVGYATAKAGLIQMTRTSAVSYAKHGIRMNCVVPGLMDTPLVHRLADKYAAGEYDAFVAHRNQQVPMGRMGDAWDVAHAALFLASDEARYVTGHALVVDGGLTCCTP